MEHFINMIIPFLVHILELMGIIVITVGSFKAFYYICMQALFKRNYEIKHQFATALATGLEFKLAAEILKTVLIRSLDELVILGAVFLLRVLMTIVIDWEIKQGSKMNTETNKK